MARALAKRRSASVSDASGGDDDEGDRRAAQIKRVKRERQLPTPSPSQALSESVQDEEDISDLGESDGSYDEDEDIDTAELPNDEEALSIWEEVQARRKTNQDSLKRQFVPEAGLIKSVHLVDFMCHQHLSLDMAPKMTFIVGHNGSGKSAALTAITVALGGKASITGRGTGIKDLIRTGCDKAVITIVFSNSGIEAFRPDVYDPCVVVERTIFRNGSSSYKTRASRDGKVIATKKDEITAITQKFSIVVDSPLTILTQDQAKSFLATSNDKKLYDFFLSGTCLADLAQSYTRVEENLAQVNNLVSKQRRALPDLEAEVEHCKRLTKSAQRLVEMQAKYDRLLQEQAWSFVRDIEKQRQRQKEKVDEIEGAIEGCLIKKHKAEQDWQEIEPKLQQINDQLVELQDKTLPFKQKYDDISKTVRNLEADIRDNEANVDEVRADIDKHNRDVKEIEKRIEANARRGTEEESPEVIRDREKLQKLRILYDQLVREKPIREEELAKATQACDAAKKDIENWEPKRSSLEQQLGEANGRLQNLQSQASDRLSAFGDKMDLVLRAINAEQWERGKPIGPLGMYVKLNDTTYQAALHSFMGSTLCQFVVHCDADRVKMMRILQKCHAQGYRAGSLARHQRNSPHAQIPGVIQQAPELFDYSAGDLDRSGKTILSELTIENEIVKRVLIAKHNIERSLLWPTIRSVLPELRRLLREEHHQSLLFITADGHRATGAANTENAGPLGEWRGNTLLSKELEADIRFVQKQIHEITQRRDAARVEGHRLVERRKAAEEVARLEHKKLLRVQNGIGPTRRQMDDLENKREEDVSGDFGAGQKNRDDALGRVRGAEQQYAALQGTLANSKEKLSELKQKREIYKRELDALQPAKANAVEAMKVLAAKRATEKAAIEHWITKARQKEEDKVREERVLADQDVEIEKRMEDAKVFSEERVYSNRAVEDLQRERKAMLATLNAAAKRSGIVIEDVTAQLNAAEKRLQDARLQTDEMSNLAKILKETVQNRKIWWQFARGAKAIAANCGFMINMEKRSIGGQLHFDHNQGLLEVLIDEQETRKGGSVGTGRKYKTVQTMSGGERSFVTVSLLLSLWEAGASPLRCLDEWDVFLDAANRGVAGAMLVEGAAESHGTQFILITPQNMGGINTGGNHNRVVRMPDPIRNQTVLPFRPV